MNNNICCNEADCKNVGHLYEIAKTFQETILNESDCEILIILGFLIVEVHST